MSEIQEPKKVRASKEPDYQREYYRSWYQKNKQRHIDNVIRNKKNRPAVYIDCPCGSRIVKYSKRYHEITNKHQNYMKMEAVKEE